MTFVQATGIDRQKLGRLDGLQAQHQDLQRASVNPSSIARIALVTDFGVGIYPGQLRARLCALVPDIPVIDLVHDLPPFRPDLAAYLLPALVRDMPRGTLYVCVVDPGVGGERDVLVLEADGDWFVGPDNGLLSRMAQGAHRARMFRIGWRPEWLSASFHGRDWFAPAAARLCLGQSLDLTVVDMVGYLGSDWPPSLASIVYVDGYGNLMCGLQAADFPPEAKMVVGVRQLSHSCTFCEVLVGEAFWYENALGLVEIAVNQGRADLELGLGPGDPVQPPAVTIVGNCHV